MKYETIFVKEEEFRSTSYVPNVYVSKCGTRMYNSELPHRIIIFFPERVEYKYQFAAPNKLLHKAVALAWVYNPCPSIFNIVDHIDRESKHNHATNLRWVTQKLNMSNLAHGVGVYFDERWSKWIGRVTIDDKIFAKKSFKTQAEAADFAHTSREQKFEQLYSKNVQQQLLITPGRLRPRGYVYWRDDTRKGSDRSPTFVSTIRRVVEGGS